MPENVRSHWVGLPLILLASITTDQTWLAVSDHPNVWLYEPPKSATVTAPSIVVVTLLFGLDPSYWVSVTVRLTHDATTFGVCAEAGVAHKTPAMTAEMMAVMVLFTVRWLGIRFMAGSSFR